MLLLAAAVMVALASVSAANDQRQVVRYSNGNVVPDGTAMSNARDMAAGRVSPFAGGMAQQGADDRSLIIPKVIALKAIKKHKKKGKKHPFKSPFKGLFPLISGAALGIAGFNGFKGPVPVPPNVPIYSAPIPENTEFPVWKVHKYNGIEIRPVRLSEIPLPPPSDHVEYKEVPVISEPPKEVNVPAPVYGLPQEPYPGPADTVVFPETPTPPAQTYGVPVQTYGIPAQTYGVPALTYGVPAQTYGVPTQTFSFPYVTYQAPPQGYPVSGQQTFNGPISQLSPVSGPEELSPPVDEAATAESLETLSNLGSLTDLIPGGGDSGSFLPSLFGGGGAGNANRGVPFSFFNRFRGQQPTTPTKAPAEDANFRQPAQSPIQNLLGRIPIISSLTNFGSENPATHVNIPILPELPALPEVENARGPNVQIPQIPHIRLPTRYVVRGSPYIAIRNPSQPQTTFPLEAQPPPAPEPVAKPEAPAVEPVKPEPSYPLPLEQPQPQPQPQYGIVNSYGQPVQTGYYVTPVITAPAPPQFAVPYYPGPVAGVPAPQYGLPGGDSSGAASEIDPATVTECGDEKACSQEVLKVVVPEGTTRTVSKPQAPAAPSPVYKKNGVKEVPVEVMTKYLDPRHVAAPKTQSASPVIAYVDAQPSTNTDEVESS